MAAAERRAVGIQHHKETSSSWTATEPNDTGDEEEPYVDEDDEDMGTDEGTAVDAHNEDMGTDEGMAVDAQLRPPPAVRPWARRIAEPTPKVRRTEGKIVQEDDRVSALVQQVAQLAKLWRTDSACSTYKPFVTNQRPVDRVSGGGAQR